MYIYNLAGKTGKQLARETGSTKEHKQEGRHPIGAEFRKEVNT